MQVALHGKAQVAVVLAKAKYLAQGRLGVKRLAQLGTGCAEGDESAIGSPAGGLVLGILRKATIAQRRVSQSQVIRPRCP